MKTYGEAMRIAREKKGWTVYQLARESDVSVTNIIAYEEGKSVPGLFPLMALCEALEIGIDKYTGFDQNKFLQERTWRYYL